MRMKTAVHPINFLTANLEHKTEFQFKRYTKQLLQQGFAGIKT